MMKRLDIVHQRLHNQRIASTTFEKPGDVVQWLGAVQAQDYAAAKWAIAERTKGVADTAMDQAFSNGAILRTHLLRPTWHFVTPADIRWILALTAPRVNAVNAHWYRRLALEEAVFARSNAALVKALQGGRQLTRRELASVLQQAGIPTDDSQSVTYIMMRAELDGIVCSGPRRGKQFTYALLDERAPQARTLERDEALAELARRYFTSRGPATLQDFAWWSGLTTSDAASGLEMVKPQLMSAVMDGKSYWFADSMPPAKDISQTACLLPNFDEYIVGYTDRSAVFDASHTNKLGPRDNVLFNHLMIMNGRVVGTWKRTLKKSAVVIEANPFVPLNAVESRALAVAAQRYGEFLGLSVVLA